MKDKFQMSSMGELTFFLGLQVKQKPDGIFISQDKYVAEILRKFSLTDRKSASTPIDTEKPLLKDPDGEDVDMHTYRSMIGSLIQEDFRYLKGKPHLGLWYLKDSPFNLVSYSNSNYAGASLDRKSTTRGYQFLGCRLISWQCKKQTVVATSSTEVNDVTRLQALVDKKKVIITEATIREALRLDDAESIDCLPNEEIFTELSKMGYEKPSIKLTFYKAFFLPQWKFLIHNILQCISAKKTSWNKFISSFGFSCHLPFNRAQVGDLSLHSTKYSSLALTQKVFANMRRVGKGFSGVDTHLFEGMILAQQDDDVADEGGKISDKGKIKIGKLDFNDVYFVKELKFNLFSISQICDKKNNVLFTDTECIVLSLEFKMPDENQVLLKVHRENNMYNVDLKSIVPTIDLTCLFAKTTK
nr:putative ribonuclease H-like domain-containing protein [Tanacetum cinerariifolium]